MLWGVTLKQPWASAIAYGPKRVENRLWPPSPDLPFWLAIHAGANKEDLSLLAESELGQLWSGYPRAPMPHSAIIAVAQVVGAVPEEVAARSPADGVAEWAMGPWCWLLTGVVAFGSPVPCRGSRGLWPVVGPLLLAVRAEYARATAEVGDGHANA
jgi:hypothetical protein